MGDQGDLEDGDAVSQAVVDGVAGLLDGTDDDGVKDDGYDVLNNVQTTLLCLMECGEDPVTVESGGVTVGAQSGTLEQLAGEPILLGDSGAVFIFPSDLTELEKELGKDTCLYTGTSTNSCGVVYVLYNQLYHWRDRRGYGYHQWGVSNYFTVFWRGFSNR